MRTPTASSCSSARPALRVSAVPASTLRSVVVRALCRLCHAFPSRACDASTGGYVGTYAPRCGACSGAALPVEAPAGDATDTEELMLRILLRSANLPRNGFERAAAERLHQHEGFGTHSSCCRTIDTDASAYRPTIGARIKHSRRKAKGGTLLRSRRSLSSLRLRRLNHDHDNVLGRGLHLPHRAGLQSLASTSGRDRAGMVFTLGSLFARRERAPMARRLTRSIRRLSRPSTLLGGSLRVANQYLFTDRWSRNGDPRAQRAERYR